MTASSDFKVNNFDLLRIFAATQVALNHGVMHLGVPKPSWWPIMYAFPGVPIFFVISGFLISASFERNPNLASYFRNRLLRIFPGLWFCIALTTIAILLFGYHVATLSGVTWFFSQLAGVIYTPEPLQHFGFGSYNGSLWTIPIELQFYFLLPLIYLATRSDRRRTLVISALLLLFTAVAYFTTRTFSPLDDAGEEPLPQKLLRYSFFPHFYLFLSGIAMQRAHFSRRPWIVGKGLFWAAAYLGFHLLMPYSAAMHVFGTLLLGVAAISLAYSAPALSERLLRGNDISYGAYIYHGLVINMLLEFGLTGRPAYVAAALGITFVAALLSWTLLEKPLLRWKRRSIHPPTTTVAVRT
jgi:peptidoglycan/LPS O-acetylase OafA/YrhL